MISNSFGKFRIFCWTLFDFSNTAFSVMIVTFAYPLYYKNILCGNSPNSDLLWGVTVSISMFITALISPVLGAASDHSQNRKKILFIFTLFSIVSTSLLYFTQSGMLLVGTLLFILANIGFEGGIVFYDSFLPDITNKNSLGRVSGYGFAMGYLGAFAILLINLPFLKGGIVPENLLNVRYSFLITAAFFLTFSIPMFIILKERKSEHTQTSSYLKIGFRRVFNTIHNLIQYKNVTRFLIAFFIYNDGILTVISFAAIIAQQTFNFTVGELVIFFLSVQSTAVLGSIIFGIISDKIGAKKTITLTLILWILTTTVALFAITKIDFYLIGFLAGLLLGSSQAASRGLMAKLTPKTHEAEFFGFYDGLCGKASAIIGPLLFGLISSLAGSQKIAILTVGSFFLVGLVILQRVEE